MGVIGIGDEIVDLGNKIRNRVTLWQAVALIDAKGLAVSDFDVVVWVDCQIEVIGISQLLCVKASRYITLVCIEWLDKDTVDITLT